MHLYVCNDKLLQMKCRLNFPLKKENSKTGEQPHIINPQCNKYMYMYVRIMYISYMYSTCT